MKAVRFYGVGDIRTEEIEKPVPEENEALIKVLYAGICGSDLHIYRKGMFITYLQETMGHEFVGIVESAPSSSNLSTGTIVVGDPRVFCGECLACEAGMHQRCDSLGFIGEVSQGCFAEFITLKVDKLIALSPSVNLVQAALIEPIAVALHICKKVKDEQAHSAVIFGAGPIGLICAYLLKAVYGIKRLTVVDIADYRLSLARMAGADEVVASLSNAERGNFDLAIDAAGVQQTLSAAFEAVASGGLVLLSGIHENPIVWDPNTVIYKELRVLGNNAYTFDDLRAAALLVESGVHPFDFIVSSIVEACEAPEAFKRLTAVEKKDTKILIRF